MKCPKCGYLGFETTDRCRNCQYDFSLAPFSSEPELTLHGADRNIESANGDFDLSTGARQGDRSSTSALDLDRLFGDADPGPAKQSEPTITVLDDEQPPAPIVIDDEPAAAIAMSIENEPAAIAAVYEPEQASEPHEESPSVMTAASDDAALPFEDGPIMPPPAARQPLAVRRSTPEVPRNRPRTTRPVRTEPLDFEPARTATASQDASETVASLMELPSLGARVGAGAIDLLLLVGIDAIVVYLTLRVTGLQNTLEDLRVLSPVPFIGFLFTLAFGYVAAFTVAGGQTIGKMVLSLRVIGDDGRPVDAAGGMLRALGCMLVPITLGLSYLPALFTSDHRAIHDRLAGTRVVQE